MKSLWAKFFETLWWLLVAHTITDAVLQDPKWTSIGEFKQRHVTSHWPYWLFAHGVLNGLGVYLVTRSLSAMLFETGFHMLIDWGKCEAFYGVHTDQFLHGACKVTWAWLSI